jgi:hypothetical protein
MSEHAIRAAGGVATHAEPSSDTSVKAKSGPMTPEELRALPVSFPLTTAGRAFDIGRTKAHELARAGDFPCRVLKIGNSYRVTRADLFRALGVEDELMAAVG